MLLSSVFSPEVHSLFEKRVFSTALSFKKGSMMWVQLQSVRYYMKQDYTRTINTKTNDRFFYKQAPNSMTQRFYNTCTECALHNNLILLHRITITKKIYKQTETARVACIRLFIFTLERARFVLHLNTCPLAVTKFNLSKILHQQNTNLQRQRIHTHPTLKQSKRK